MALIECRECGAKISNKADACPSCGRPIRPRKSVAAGCSAVMVGGVLLVFAAVLLGYGSKEPASLSSAPATPDVEKLPILISPWPPVDPDQRFTPIEFTTAWAKKLQGLHSLEELQRAAGSKGKITERDKGIGSEFARYHWISMPKNGRPGAVMLATLYSDGSVGVGIMTNDGTEVVVNTLGAFICDKCRPPINITGLPPPW